MSESGWGHSTRRRLRSLARSTGTQPNGHVSHRANARAPPFALSYYDSPGVLARRVKDESLEKFKLHRYGIKEAMEKAGTDTEDRYTLLERMGTKQGFKDQFNEEDDEEGDEDDDEVEEVQSDDDDDDDEET